VTVVQQSRGLEELLARDLLVLDQGFVITRYDKESLARIASRKRQVSFGVTLGVLRSVLSISYVRPVLEGEGSAAVVLSRDEVPPRARLVTVYTDILPVRLALFLEPEVPDEFGPSARRLEELTDAVSAARRLGARLGPDVWRELDELNRVWERTRIFRRFPSRPGKLVLSIPSPSGPRLLSWAVRGGGYPLCWEIMHLHRYLGSTVGVIASHENAVSRRDAVVRARAEGRGEAELRARLIVKRVDGALTVGPYARRVRDRGRLEEVLEFYNVLLTVSDGLRVEAVERLDTDSVAFEATLRVRAAHHQEPRGAGTTY